VTQRKKDIGIRLALGARSRDVVASVMWESAAVLGVGLVGGALLIVLAGQTVAAMLFGVTAGDVASLAIAGVVVAGIVAAASYLPARQAATVDPVIALRQD
ncbi:MAG: FtsX-like permease family protein, partial [Acidobacteriota bacterium]|nr:FtsX-like permease family protein [Acidobacteriota bacterium]